MEGSTEFYVRLTNISRHHRVYKRKQKRNFFLIIEIIKSDEGFGCFLSSNIFKDTPLQQVYAGTQKTEIYIDKIVIFKYAGYLCVAAHCAVATFDYRVILSIQCDPRYAEYEQQ